MRADRFYRALLRLYPAEFRARYTRAMTDFHRDRFAEARKNRESIALLWLRTITDVVGSAAAEHFQNFFAGETSVETLAQDIAYAIRGLARRPGFTAIVVATIALGIGANAAIFSVVNGILLRPLPYPNADRVASFGHEPPHWLASDPDFVGYKSGMTSLAGLSAYVRREATLTGGDQPERVRIVRATEEFFPVLGVAPALGRVFASDEYVPRVAQVVVISHSLWQRRYGGDPKIVGRTISIEGVPRTVVGVMPRYFDYPEARTDLWLPFPRFNLDSLGDRSNHYLFMVARLKPGVSLERARAEASTVAQRMMRDFPDKFDPKRPIVPHLSLVRDDLVGNARPYLIALLAAVGFVLLIASANVANLLLVRGEARHKEMAVRNALGASRARLVSQLLTESSLLAGLGGVLGLVVAWAGDRALVALAPPSIPRLDAIGVDWRVVAFTAAVAIATGLMIGLLPAWRASSGNSVDALKDAGRVVGSQGSARGVRRALVVAEVALAVTTLAGSGMLLRSLWNLQASDLGFDPANTLTAKVSLQAREYDDARSSIFFEQVLERVRALPGVRAAGAGGWLPVVDAGGLWGIQTEGMAKDVEWPMAVPQQATPGFFKAMGIPLVAGREFTSADRVDAPFVAVVSEKLAATLWPGQNALGKRFNMGRTSPYLTVVGIAHDTRSHGFSDVPEAAMYFPYAQSAKSTYFAPRSMAIVARVDGDPAAIASSVVSIVHSLDRTVPVSEVRTLEQVVGTAVSTRRFNTGLLAGFALLALVLAGIGTYGVISYAVSQRSHEIGVRMALGAEDRSVLMLVMSEGMRLCVIGVALGLAASIAVGRAIRAMLVGVPMIDVPTLAVTAVMLVAVGALASALPARRALAVSPIDTLRG